MRELSRGNTVERHDHRSQRPPLARLRARGSDPMRPHKVPKTKGAAPVAATGRHSHPGLGTAPLRKQRNTRRELPAKYQRTQKGAVPPAPRAVDRSNATIGRTGPH